MSADRAVDEAVAEVEQQISVLFSRVRTVWKESAEHVHPDLQPAGYKLLGTIVRLGTTNAHVLSQMFDMDKSAVSRQVRALEDAGLVESRPDERDGRARVLVATPDAIERIRAVRERNLQRMRDVLSDRSADDLRLFADMLSLLAEG